MKNYQQLVLGVFVAILSACQTKGQNSSIHEATYLGDITAVKKHIEAGTDLNQKDAYGSAPLSISAVFGKTDVAKLLIDAGADVNVKSADGSTPLHSSSFFCRKEITQMLLNAGADISIRNNYGSTALESMKAPFDDIKPIYDQLGRDLGPLGLKLDYDFIQKTRPEIAKMIESKK